MLKATPQWSLGRRGEILQIGAMSHLGFAMMDVGGSTNAKAPLLRQFQVSICAPDAVSFMTGPLWIEFKTKQKANSWRGGSLSDQIKTPPREEHGLDRRNYVEYLRVQARTFPVVIVVLSIATGEMLGNSLRGLGEPRQSPHQDYDLVNWDVRKFRTLLVFDSSRLRRYFYHKNGVARDAPTDMPSSSHLFQVVDWLRPEQREFHLFRMDLAAQLESDWRVS